MLKIFTCAFFTKTKKFAKLFDLHSNRPESISFNAVQSNLLKSSEQTQIAKLILKSELERNILLYRHLLASLETDTINDENTNSGENYEFKEESKRSSYKNMAKGSFNGLISRLTSSG